MTDWFEERDFDFSIALQWLTPFGMPLPHVFTGETDPRAACNAALKELGLEDSAFPRSLLTPEEEPYPLTLDDKLYLRAGPDCDAFHGQSFEERERVEWISLSQTKLEPLEIRGKGEDIGK